MKICFENMSVGNSYTEKQKLEKELKEIQEKIRIAKEKQELVKLQEQINEAKRELAKLEKQKGDMHTISIGDILDDSLCFAQTWHTVVTCKHDGICGNIMCRPKLT